MNFSQKILQARVNAAVRDVVQCYDPKHWERTLRRELHARGIDEIEKVKPLVDSALQIQIRRLKDEAREYTGPSKKLSRSWVY